MNSADIGKIIDIPITGVAITNRFNVLNDELVSNNVCELNYDNVYVKHSKECTKRVKNRHKRGGKGKKGSSNPNVSKNINIAFNNVNGFKSKQWEITRFLHGENISIFGLAETFLKGDQGINISGYTWVGKNRTKKQRGGIGLLVSKDVDILDDNLFESRSDDLERIWIKVKFKNERKHTFIANAYFPVEGTDPDLSTEMYTHLLSEVIRIEEFDEEPQILIGGDMNARIGDKISFGDPVRNSNGERLLSFCDDSNLSIINCSNLCFGKFTWSRGSQSSTIDYFLGSNTIMNRVVKMLVDEERVYHTGSDHNVLILNLKPDVTCHEDNNPHLNRKHFVWDIKHDQDWSVYQEGISNEFCEWDSNSFEDTNSIWESWKSKILKIANNCIGLKEIKGNHRPWSDSEIKDAVNARKQASREHRNWVKSGSDKVEEGDKLWNFYKDKKIAAKELIHKKIMEKRVEKSIMISGKGGPGCKDFWKNLRGNKNSSDSLQSLKLPNSNVITTDRTVMKQSIMQYFHTLGKMNLNLYNDSNNCVSKNTDIKSVKELTRASHFSYDTKEHLTDIHFTLDDVIVATSQSKNNKAPGIDGIINELIKNGGDSLYTSLYDMFIFLRNKEEIPDEWNKGIIIPVHKKGAKNDLGNYRGITLNSCVSKIYNRLLSKAISSFLEENDSLGEIQGGFRGNHRCEDQIFTLKSIAASRLTEGKQTYLAFLDFKKAFDSVWREGMLNAAWGVGLRGRLWRVLSNLYNNVQSQVKFGNLTTDFIDIEEGVKQGCVLSPILFCVFINELAKLLKEAKLGTHIAGVQIGCLFWADDIALIAEDSFELQKMLDIASDFSHKWRLQFNHDKSNVLVIGRRNRGTMWKLGHSFISEVSHYKYLGVKICSNLSDHGHIEEVIRKGTRLTAYIKSIIDEQDDYNRVYYGDTLWKSIGLPTVNYACSAWVPASKSDIKRLENVQTQMAKIILKAPRNMTKEALYGELGWNSIASLQDKIRLTYLDRLYKLENNRWPKLVFNASYHVSNENEKFKWKWLNHIKECLSRCGLQHIFSNSPPHDLTWVNNYRNILRQVEINDWREGTRSKSSLSLYTFLKQTPGREQYLLDNNNFQGAILKLRARTNTLHLERYIRSWSPSNEGLCKLCNNGMDEDIYHFMLTCPSLNYIRIKEFIALERTLSHNDLGRLWETFILGDFDLKLFMLLGNLYEFNSSLGEIFDTSCKNLLTQLWDARKKLLNDGNSDVYTFSK